MHSPSANGPSMTMRRPECYNYPDPRPMPREPSSKILQSLLYNFAHSGYLSGGSTTSSPPGSRSSPPVAGTFRNSHSRPESEHGGQREPSQTGPSSPEYPRSSGVCRDVVSPSHRQHPYGRPQHQQSPGHEPPHPPPRCYQAPSATVTSQGRPREAGSATYSDKYLSPRHRSSSIGSAGSSFRDSRSPSHDSTVSHDSLSRCSPLSIASSPSPSPPTLERNNSTNSSKLLGILNGGSYNYPYGITNNNKSLNDPPSSSSPSSSATLTSRPDFGIDNINSAHHRRSSSSSDHSGSLSHCSQNSRRGFNRSSTSSEHKIYHHGKYETETGSISFMKRNNNVPEFNIDKKGSNFGNGCQDEPMDLSCKPKQDSKAEPEGRKSISFGSPANSFFNRQLPWGAGYYTLTQNNLDETESDTVSTKKSILESILCANKTCNNEPKVDTPSSSHRGTPSPYNSVASPLGMASVTKTELSREEGTPSPFANGVAVMRVPNSPMCPPESPAPNSPDSSQVPSPNPSGSSSSVASHVGISSPQPRCPWRQQVTLAKKTLYPVRARVSDWFLKIVKFAKSRPEFLSLSDGDKVVLLQQSWTRLLLLFMAENNFHFAVTPVHEDTDDGRPPAISGIDPSEPTMDSVEMVQNFIRKCQSLGVESDEYTYLRVITLFHAGCLGLEDCEFVERISSGARLSLQAHVRSASPDDRLRYSSLLLCVHTLFGVNCGMVQTLFCQHLAKGSGLDEEIKNLLLKQDPLKEDLDRDLFRGATEGN